VPEEGGESDLKRLWGLLYFSVGEAF
jgi:hypothetical protein